MYNLSKTVCRSTKEKSLLHFIIHHHPKNRVTDTFNQPPLMADTSNLQPSHLKSHTPLEQEDQISSQQTLYNNFIEEEEDDDFVNVEDQHAPYNPFSSSSSYHHHHQQQQQVNSNSSSCCSSEPESDSEYVSPDSTVYPNYLYGHHEEYDQMDYITDLFHSRDSPTDVGINVSEPDYFVSNNNNIEELGLGLRLASIESDSDTEDLGQVADQNDDDNIIQTSDLNLEHVWDCPSFDMDGVDERDEYDTSSVIDRIEEISVSSDGGEANMGDLEWEILLAVNNLERDLELVMDGGEGLLYTTELDTLIGHFVETVRGLRGGSPPAAKAVIDSLPVVALKTGDAKDEYDDDNEICAVCKDGISIGEKVMQLPCRHHYHGECIVPWLSIRNTCPVCRFELPTDDVDYERRKNMENDDELRVGYGFDVDLLS